MASYFQYVFSIYIKEKMITETYLTFERVIFEWFDWTGHFFFSKVFALVQKKNSR